jgi:arylsulfatase A-like enzyme
MKRISVLLLLISAQVLYAAQTKPNVVIFLVDDLGWTDVQYDADYFPQGSRFYETPHIQDLASHGVVFNQAYAQPLCSSSRATLITGQYSSRFHLNSAITASAVDEPAYEPQTTSPLLVGDNCRKELPLHLTTLAERLRDQHGYATWHVGKWHIGDSGAGGDSAPDQRGFDRQFFTLGAGMGQGYFGPISGPQSVVYPDGSSAIEDKYTHAQEILDKICKDLIDDHAANDPDKPFFLNFWLPCVHSPYEAHVDWIEYFEGKLTDDELRHLNPVYAAMVKRWDDSLGHLIQALKDAGEYEETLFIFWSDNGGVDFEKDSKAHDPDSSTDLDITPVTLPEYSTGSGVTPTDNDPLRDGKADSYEGGVRVPALVVYPEGNFDVARLEQTPVHLVDLFPTILDFAGEGASVPSVLDHNSDAQPLDGVSIRPLLENTEAIDRDLFHYRDKGDDTVASIRRGDWKLYRVFSGGHDGHARIELYNLVDDSGETNNLAAAYVEIAAPMLETLDAWVLETVDLHPIPNPDYNGLSKDDPEYDYQSWILERYPEAGGAEIGFDVDIEPDGLSNLQEYLLDSDPRQADGDTFGLKMIAGETNHTIYFRIPVEIAGAAYALEQSETLQEFFPATTLIEEVGSEEYGRAVFGDSYVYKATVPHLATQGFFRVSGNLDTMGRQTGSEAGLVTYTFNEGGHEPQIVDANTVNPALPTGTVLEIPIGDAVVMTDLASHLEGELYTISMDFAWHDLGGTEANEAVRYNFGTTSGNLKDPDAPLGWGIVLSGTGTTTMGTFYIGVGDGASWTDLYTQDLGMVGDDASQFYSVAITIDDASDMMTQVIFGGADITGSLTSLAVPAFGPSRALTFGVGGSGMRSLVDNLEIVFAGGETLISDNFDVEATGDINYGLQQEPVFDYVQLLLKDTFDIGDTDDINAGLDSRQSGAFSPATYNADSDVGIRGGALEIPLLRTVTTVDFGLGPDSVIGKQYRIAWLASWNDLNADSSKERFWFNLSGSAGFKGDGASVQVGLDIDNAQFYVGLDDGSGFTQVGSVSLSGVTQGGDSPENYEICIKIDETGASSILSVEFQGSEVVLSENVVQWLNGGDRSFYSESQGSGIRGYLDNLEVYEM